MSVTVGKLGYSENTEMQPPPCLLQDESSFVRKILSMIDSRNSSWLFVIEKSQIGCPKRQSLMLLAGEKN
jgi:hypothetical protein